jgi:hypothetical protein
MFPVIVCIAKREKYYIEEFIKYHIGLGFKHIILYDNEDTPTYEKQLTHLSSFVKVIHLPFNNYSKGVQYIALEHFVENFIHKTNISHVAHIDIDEFIALKKHTNICEVIEKYIVGDCKGIAMNWRFFGSSGETTRTNLPNTVRFTKCELLGNPHIKTLFSIESFIKFNTVHDVTLKEGHIKTTKGIVVTGPLNSEIDYSVIQLNHYKCKTLPEFRYIRQRQRADIPGPTNENVDEEFKRYDLNETTELTAYNFYTQRCVPCDSLPKIQFY